MVGALIGLVLQLALSAIGLLITLVAWTTRFVVMLVLAIAGGVSSRVR